MAASPSACVPPELICGGGMRHRARHVRPARRGRAVPDPDHDRARPGRDVLGLAIAVQKLPVWWLSVALGLASAAIDLPIEERPVARAPVPAPAR